MQSTSRSWLLLRGRIRPVGAAAVRPRVLAAAAGNGGAPYSSLPLPTPEGAPRTYSPKIVEMVDNISNMTILEVADLNELLKIKLNIKDVPVMAASAAAPAAAAAGAPSAEEEVEAKPREKSIFTVKLAAFDAGKKVALIKEVKNLMEGMNLVQAKKFVEGAPQTLKEDVPKEEAEALKAALEAVGGTIELE